MILAEADGKHANRKRAGRQPISRHPLFPAIVALWFAALLGTGSFALSTSLLENLVLAGHVDSLVPAAAPPLGVTARLMLALMLGLTGGTIGWFMAKRLAAPKAEGFGTTFIKRSVEYELGGAAKLTFAADGLRCDIAFPLRESGGGGITRPPRKAPDA